jgi:hypothetical protein
VKKLRRKEISSHEVANAIPNFAHMRPNCVIGSSPRIRSLGVAGRLDIIIEAQLEEKTRRESDVA